jgi:hypothetical protein
VTWWLRKVSDVVTDEFVTSKFRRGLAGPLNPAILIIQFVEIGERGDAVR